MIVTTLVVLTVLILSLIYLLFFKSIELERMRSSFQINSSSNIELVDKIGKEISDLNSVLSKTLRDSREENINSLLGISRNLSNSIENIRSVVDVKLTQIEEKNNKHLDKIRNVVEEKLQSTLESRLSSSFKIVSDRLDLVYKGLGEMQLLAKGVGDLKDVLTNVKVRGTWGEVQLKAILQQMLFPNQYEENVLIQGGDRVEFAIKLPGDSEEVLLPIDSKFPLEECKKDKESLTRIANIIKGEAKKISEKYIHPPKTTDFAIMFVPTERLYSEILNIPDIFNTLQTKYRVTVAGPWTLAAILNSLQLGFKSLAIQKSSSEIWKMLGIIKREFVKFGTLLDKSHKKIIEAGNVIENASRKSRTIEKKLNKIEDSSHFIEYDI